MATFDSRALGLLLLLTLCFATWSTDASGVAPFSGDENDAQQLTTRQLRVKPNDTLDAPMHLERDALKNDRRQLFLITSIISNLFGLEEDKQKKLDSGSSSSAGSAIPTPTPTSAPAPAAPKSSPTLNATLPPTVKPTRDPLGKISW